MEILNDRQYLKSLGAHIRKLRSTKFKSIKEMAGMCNMECARISRIESGNANITMLTLLSLAACLEMPISKLLDFPFR